MSDTEKQNDVVDAVKSSDAVNTAKNAAGNVMSSLMALKDSNPKVFYGGVGAVAVLLIIMMTSGGDSPSVKAVGGAVAKNIVVGQKYILQSPNSYEKEGTIKLVPVPGTIAAFDDAEEETASACRLIKQGTPVTVMSLSDAYGKKDAFAQVKIEDGECKGKDGWALSIDLQ